MASEKSFTKSDSPTTQGRDSERTNDAKQGAEKADNPDPDSGSSEENRHPKVQVRVPEDRKEAFAERCEELGTTQTRVLNDLIEEFLENTDGMKRDWLG